MRLEGVSKRYGRGAPAVFEAVDLELAPATLTLLSGPNGAGKSTLLRIIAGAARPSSGFVSDRPQDLGYAPDRLGGSEALTARQYLTLHGRVRHLGRRTAAARIEELAARMDFGRDLDTRIGRLSKGNARKLGIIQAMLSPTRLLVLDEPFASLDRATATTVNELIAQEVGTGNTVILSDHERRTRVMGQQHQRVELVSGRLRPADPDSHRPAAATSIIRLGHLERPTPLAELSSVAGVLSVNADHGGPVSVSVERGRTDSFLTTVLAAGWSVLTVAEGPEQ